MGFEAPIFHILTNPQIGDNDAVTDFLKAEGTSRGDAPRCPVCQKFIGMKVWNPPFQVEMEFWGTVHGDIAFFMEDLLVSRRLADHLAMEKISGVDILSPVHIYSVKPKRMAKNIPEYLVARVRRSGAVFDPVGSKAEYRVMWNCKECLTGEMLRHQRVELMPGTWSGEDLFVAKGLPGVIITSDRFRQFCLSHRFRNVKLIEASKYGVDWFPEKT
jgi:hypothetical protein